MSYLIAINERTKEVLHPEVLKFCDAFTLLNEKEMLYVVLFTDYSSIYKQFPEHERKRRAMWHAFDENESQLIESQKIKDAIEQYTTLQYNPKIELVNKFRKKIESELMLLEIDETSIGLKKHLENIALLETQIANLQNQVTDQLKADGVIKGDRQLSFLEQKLSDKKSYKDIKNKKPKIYE